MAEQAALPAARRRRVQILKRMILAALAVSVIVPVLLCVVLLFRLHSLESRLAVLTEKLAAFSELTPQDDRTGIPGAESGQQGLSGEDGQQEAVGEEGQVPASGTLPDTDASEGQTASATRKVYLTFDDGPSSNTDDILDILNAYDVKATFFVVGKEGEWAEKAYRRIVAEGHTLGMHSYTHEYSTVYASEEAFLSDMDRLRSYLEEVTGEQCSLYRFPGGSSNRVSDTDMRELIDCLTEREITYFDWNVSSQDATNPVPDAETILANCLEGIRKHQGTVVVLMHDAASKGSTVEALPALIEAIQGMEDTELLPITEDTVPVQHIKKTQDETEE